MPRFFFNLHDGVSQEDHEGTELVNVEHAKREAVRFAGRLLQDRADDFWNGEEWMIEVKDQTGLILFTLLFEGNLAPALHRA